MAEQILLDVSGFPKAAELLNAVLSGKYRVICYGGAIRGGKSFNSLGAITLLHRIFPKSRSVIIREDLERLKKNTLPTLEKVFPKNFIKAYNKTDHSWTFTNESYCMFFGENIDKDPLQDRFNGLEFNFALLDQAEELNEMTFDKVLERLGSYVLPAGYKQPPPVVIITVNPTDTWVRKKIYEPWKEGTLPANWLYIPALITDNPHIPDSFKESLLELKKVNPIKYEKYVNGDWDAKERTGMEFYTQFNQSRHVGKFPMMADTKTFHLSFDFNVVPYMTMMCCQVLTIDNKKTFRFFREYCLPNPDNSSRAISQYFIRDFAHLKPLVFYYGDSTGKNRIAGQGNKRNFDDIEAVLISFLSSASDRVIKNPNQFKARDFINLIFAGYWKDIAIEIDESCVELIKDLNNVKLGIEGKVKERVNDKQLGVSYEKYGHTSDAMTYLIVSVLYDLYNSTSAIG